MLIFLQRVDALPNTSDFGFNFIFTSWLAVLIDTLNETINLIETTFNLLPASSYTATEITDMFTAGSLTNGVLLYDTTSDEYVGMQAGALVKFTTASYP